MSLKNSAILLLAAALLTLTSCSSMRHKMTENSFLHDQSQDYQESEAYPALYVPEPLVRKPASTIYDIPSIPTPDGYAVDIQPPDFRS